MNAPSTSDKCYICGGAYDHEARVPRQQAQTVFVRRVRLTYFAIFAGPFCNPAEVLADDAGLDCQGTMLVVSDATIGKRWLPSLLSPCSTVPCNAGKSAKL